MKLKKGDVVKTKSDLGAESWKICLPVTKPMLKSKTSINADKTGLHLFYGMWYGNNPLSTKSFGKIEEIPEEFEYVGHISQISLEEFKQHST